MKKPAYPVKEIKPGVWRVEEWNLGTMYVVAGRDRGLVIDTGTGIGNFRALVEELLRTPYDVVLTHGHTDHAGGTHQFEKIYVHGKDIPMVKKVSLAGRRDYAERIHGTYPESSPLFDPVDMTVENGHPELIPMGEGKIFDLGDKQIEVFACPGHTNGSVNLLDKADGILFSGDNHQHLELVTMEGEDRKAVINRWLRGVRRSVRQQKEGLFETLCGGHEELEADLLSDLLACGEGIVKGKIKPKYKKVHIFEAPMASFGRVNLIYMGFGGPYRYELMRPDQIREAQKKCSVAFLPVGPLEWHGPAMPFGTDPLTAAAVAEGAVKRLGAGVLLPTLFFGTERAREERILKNIGFKGDEYIIGQDFPKNTLPSMYAREEIFALTVSEYLRMLEKQGFKMAVIVNGHGADGQMASLDRLAKQYTGETGMKVIVPRFFGEMKIKGDPCGGHATMIETALMLALTDSVDFTKLPPKEIPLNNTDWGITDGPTYAGKNQKGIVLSDPRKATAAQGKACVKAAAERLSEIVAEEYAGL